MGRIGPGGHYPTVAPAGGGADFLSLTSQAFCIYFFILFRYIILSVDILLRFYVSIYIICSIFTSLPPKET